MKMRTRTTWIALALILGLPGLLLMAPQEAGPVEVGDPVAQAAFASHEGPQRAYAQWKQRYFAAGGDRNAVLQLGWSEGMSVQPSDARGRVSFDLVEGWVRVTVRGGEGLGDVWLVDNQPRPEDSIAPQPWDDMVRLGALDGEGRLSAFVGKDFFPRFEPDLVVVTRPGERPDEAGVLFAIPGLFQRLRNQELRMLAAERSRQVGPALPFVTQPAFAAVFTPDPFDALITKGADLFFTETFKGNGRTCGTCHPADNNFTIDPQFISTLPPKDPLFVAEFVEALKENFEKPKLMRKVGLILENTDGFGDLENLFTMRGVPHTLGLPTSITPDDDCGENVNATGWSCDGAPDDGSIRAFAKGAVIQHFPKTLTRMEANGDFVLPDDDQLDALAAFQLALGRSNDPKLDEITFTNPVVAEGKTLFLAPSSRCNFCHNNGGANTAEQVGDVFGPNTNFDTGVEQLLANPASIVDPDNFPPDGGFGRNIPCPKGGIGNCEFNTAGLVEAADTPPFFHNNAVATIEGAVAFYNSDAFANSPVGSPPINLDASEVDAIAAFLRVLNAIDNIRSTAALGEKAVDVVDFEQAKAILEVMIADTTDAQIVLFERGIETDAQQLLLKANSAFKRAARTTNHDERAELIKVGVDLVVKARDTMASGTFWT